MPIHGAIAPFVQRLPLGWLLLAGALLTLEGLIDVGLVRVGFLPAPSDVARSLWYGVTSGRIAEDATVTLSRAFAGYGVAVLVGVSVGVAAGASPTLYRCVDPFIELLRPIPAPALVPLAISLLGLGESMKVVAVAVACFFPIFVVTVNAVRNLDPIPILVSKTFGITNCRLLMRVILPASMPTIFIGLRTSLSIALIVTVVTEMIASTSGMGFFIFSAERLFHEADMYAGVVALGAIGYALNQGINLIEMRVLGWHIASRLSRR